MHPEPIEHFYLHIPFCPTKCHYCAFVTHVGSLRLREPYVRALTKEIEGLQERRRPGMMQTVYLGGGTPSMLDPAQVGELLNSISQRAGIAPGAEITLEAHPDTVDRVKLDGFGRVGVNRVSFGVESLDATELIGIGRSHTPERVGDLMRLCRDVGFNSVNLDLMYGLPGQTRQSWRRSLDALVALAPDHISLYPLMVEPKTVFGRRARQGELYLPGDEDVVKMYHDACGQLRAAGYEHYEVANWAKPGHACRHNLAYWRDKECFGAGVGAHGYVRPYRTENMRGVRRYIDTLESGRSPVVARELVDSEAEAVETITLRLRLLREGLDLAAVEARFGRETRWRAEEASASLVSAGLMQRADDHLLLAEEAVPVANEIWERFLPTPLPAAG